MRPRLLASQGKHPGRDTAAQRNTFRSPGSLLIKLSITTIRNGKKKKITNQCLVHRVHCDPLIDFDKVNPQTHNEAREETGHN